MSRIYGHNHNAVKRYAINLVFDASFVNVIIVDYGFLQALALADCNRKNGDVLSISLCNVKGLC